jgi:hypothetical protein
MTARLRLGGAVPPAPSPGPVSDKCELLLVGECTTARIASEREWCGRCPASFIYPAIKLLLSHHALPTALLVSNRVPIWCFSAETV